MASIMESLMKGYSDRVLGQDPNVQAQQTASAYAQLQDAISGQYAEQKKQWETDPANQGKEWQAPDPLTRLRDQIGGLITSGDPRLQQRGLQLLGTVQPKAGSTPAAIQEYQYAVGQGYQGTFADWKKAQKSGTTVNINQGAKQVSISDLKNLTLPDGSPVPPGTTYDQLTQLGATVKPTEGEATKATAIDQMQSSITDIGDVINSDGFDNTLSGLATQIRTRGDWIGGVADTALKAAGIDLAPGQAKLARASRQLGSQILKVLSGASATEDEYNRVMSQLPSPGQPPELFRANYIATIKNYNTMAARARASGIDIPDIKGVDIGKARVNVSKPAVPSSLAKPGSAGKFTSPSGITFTVE